MMTCTDLATRIQCLSDDAAPREVARLCLLLSNAVDDFECLKCEDLLRQCWRDMTIRLQATTDQHAAMSEELQVLAAYDVQQFGAEQVWLLIRAIKVQNQVLHLYADHASE